MTVRKFKHFNWGSINFEFGDEFRAYGIRIKFFGEENTLQLSIFFHWAIYLGIDIKNLGKKLKLDRGWRIGADVSGRWITIDFLSNKEVSDVFFDWVEFITGKAKFITGKAKFSEKTLSLGSCEVVMPENRYQGDYEVKRQTWTYTRWSVAKQRDLITVNIDGKGIPIPGKGENSWDMGDDAIRSVSSVTNWDNPHLSLKHALDDLAMSVLKRRQKYASLDWLPVDEVDDIIKEHSKINKIDGA